MGCRQRHRRRTALDPGIWLPVTHEHLSEVNKDLQGAGPQDPASTSIRSTGAGHEPRRRFEAFLPPHVLAGVVSNTGGRRQFRH